MVYKSAKNIWSRIPLINTRTKVQDIRASRFVAVIDCILNQNSRDSGAAIFPAMNWPVVELCHHYQIGMLQMPCPEMAYLGFYRNRPPGISIREALDTPEGRANCRQLSITFVDRVEELIRQGAELIAVLGGNPESPGCAVNFSANSRLPSGVYISELAKEFDKRHISVPFLAIRDYKQSLLDKDLQQLEQLFSNI